MLARVDSAHARRRGDRESGHVARCGSRCKDHLRRLIAATHEKPGRNVYVGISDHRHDVRPGADQPNRVLRAQLQKPFAIGPRSRERRKRRRFGAGAVAIATRRRVHIDGAGQVAP